MKKLIIKTKFEKNVKYLKQKVRLPNNIANRPRRIRASIQSPQETNLPIRGNKINKKERQTIKRHKSDALININPKKTKTRKHRPPLRLLLNQLLIHPRNRTRPRLALQYH